MAYSATGLTPIGGQSKAGNATVNTSGYFNSASDLLKVGDLMYIRDSATPTASLVIVLSNASSVVDVSDGTAISVADAD